MPLRCLAAATLALVPAAVLLGACVQRDYLVADTAAEGPPTGEARYTANVSYITSVEVIPLRIDPAFPPEERQEILRAIAEWNHVLNGYVRLSASVVVFRSDSELPRKDIVPPRSNSWSILPMRGAAPIGRRVVRPMAVTQPLPSGGGVIMIHRELAGLGNLAAAMRHEIGHALGLLHDPASRLMSPALDPRAQRCIDKVAVATVAGMRGLPIEQLNWCEDADPTRWG